MVYAELRESVSRANQDIVRAGLVVLAFGNASAVDRTAGVMAIKPSGMPYESLRPEAIVVVALSDGSVVDGDYRPSSDTPTHLVLYRRFTSIGGVVHTHSSFATSWAQAAMPIPCLGTTHADHFRGSVPVTRQLTQAEIDGDYEAKTGEAIVEFFRNNRLDPLENPAAIVASHGPFTWGVDVGQAVDNAIALETVAAMAFHAMQLRPDLPEIGDALRIRHFERKHGPAAYYGQRMKPAADSR
jgi:L-ribulose-5-phosphate 4-epimerase